MNTVKFHEYRPTPGEKHLGIATILLNDIIYLRFKITAGKNGGFFPNAPSYKVTDCGIESYISAILIESTMLKEQVDTCIKNNVNKLINQPNAYNSGPSADPYGHQQPQVHAPQPQYQPPAQGSYMGATTPGMPQSNTFKFDPNEEIPF